MLEATVIFPCTPPMARWSLPPASFPGRARRFPRRNQRGEEARRPRPARGRAPRGRDPSVVLSPRNYPSVFVLSILTRPRQKGRSRTDPAAGELAGCDVFSRGVRTQTATTEKYTLSLHVAIK